MQFTLRQLEVFLSIAKTGNLTRAAEKLNMSQSAASSALKDLETHFELRLFDRIGKRLHLNEQGKTLRPQAESLIIQANELERSLLSSQQINKIHIGATLTIANFLAVEIVAEYLQKFQNAPVSLEIHNTKDIVDQVLSFELDMGMIEGETHHSQLKVIPWRDDNLDLFCSPNHPLATKKTVSDEDLIAAKWILREMGSGTRQTFNRAMHGLVPSLDITLELRETDAIKRAVKHNIGLGCLSTLSLQEDFERGDLVQLKIPKRDLRRKLYLIIHEQKYVSGSLQNWLNLCQSWNPA